MSGIPHFDCYPSDFLNGVIGLPADQISVYAIILMLQYDRGGPVHFEGREREIAVRSGMSRGRLLKAVSELCRLGKLKHENGLVWNDRAERELEKIREKLTKNRENSAKGGEANRARIENKLNEINEGNKPNGYPNGYPFDSPNQNQNHNKNIEASPLVEAGASTDQAVVVPISRKPDPSRGAAIRSFGEWWNDLASSLSLPQIDRIEGSREVTVLQRARRLREDHGSLEEGLQFLEAKIRGSPFLQGKTGWRGFSFDWCLKAANFQKIVEGNYEREIQPSRRR